ncbi:MAG: phosphonoacetaldehyde hydrolase [Proteobacteria bacterium]|uniref:Phosphonoacetaldehyde hydrolase n=1 Tax=Candidatus Avisuccinivibrio stercorigallinarum TaxID=2840704 RepID=A0A9D9DCL9_9GAMM|nr:phosphonoacetaldehyde hydrolase [Candidatus Avisuccinivibrio stercorigallinarum]
MPELSCVIFDWAGTTVDFGSMSPVAAFREAFLQHELVVTDEEIRAPMGMLKRDHIKTMLGFPRIRELFCQKNGREPNDADIDSIYQAFEPSLMQVLPACSSLKPYVPEAVDYLRSKGIKIGSTTGYTGKMMEVVVRCAKEQDYNPDCLVVPDEVGNQGRPFPYMIFENLRRLSIKSVREVIKIGDTLSDLEEAKNAGVFAVGVVEGSSVMGLTEDEFNALSVVEREEACRKAELTFYQHGADFVIRNLGQMDLLQQVFEHRV